MKTHILFKAEDMPVTWCGRSVHDLMQVTSAPDDGTCKSCIRARNALLDEDPNDRRKGK